MTLDFILQVLDKRKIALAQVKDQAFQAGDLKVYSEVDIELKTVETTRKQVFDLSNKAVEIKEEAAVLDG